MKQKYPIWFRQYLELESVASGLLHYEVQVVPGLLQTEQYAASVFSQHPTQRQPDWFLQSIEDRLARQEIFRKENPPVVRFLLDESMFHRRPREPRVFREQLRHLIAMTELRHVDLQIVPFSLGLHSMLDGSMTILSFDEGDDCVYVEPAGGGMIYSDPVSVAEARQRYHAVMAEALPSAETKALLISTMESST